MSIPFLFVVFLRQRALRQKHHERHPQVTTAAAQKTTGWPALWKCFVACLPGEESQQPTWSHAWHSRSSTQRVPSFRHSSQAPGVRGGGKSAAVRPHKCSHSFAIEFS